MSRGVGIVMGVGISSFFPPTSSIIKLFPLPSSLFPLNDCDSDAIDQIYKWNEGDK